MSNIPSTAIHAAFTPIQRASNDLLRARKVQAEKASHHLEDVEEIDDTAVSSVDERRDGRQNQKDAKKRQADPEENVDIATLAEPPAKPTGKLDQNSSHLDISA